MHSRHVSALGALLCGFVLSIHANASTLLGTSTLNVSDDLTVIQTSNGEVLEWLDLTATTDMLISDAVSMYQSDGFRWAQGNEVAELMNAFGITYNSIQYDWITLGIDAATAQNFTNYLGDTTSDVTIAGSLGFVDDLTDPRIDAYTYACIGIDCNSNGFIFNGTFLSGRPIPDIGVFLVRGDYSPVPLPSALWLFSTGLLSLIGFTRHAKANQ